MLWLIFIFTSFSLALSVDRVAPELVRSQQERSSCWGAKHGSPEGGGAPPLPPNPAGRQEGGVVGNAHRVKSTALRYIIA